ncbi:MAG: hypothetical protein RL616_2084, partial [Verrucomicrobiota bacterium]
FAIFSFPLGIFLKEKMTNFIDVVGAVAEPFLCNRP